MAACRRVAACPPSRPRRTDPRRRPRADGIDERPSSAVPRSGARAARPCRMVRSRTTPHPDLDAPDRVVRGEETTSVRLRQTLRGPSPQAPEIEYERFSVMVAAFGSAGSASQRLAGGGASRSGRSIAPRAAAPPRIVARPPDRAESPCRPALQRVELPSGGRSGSSAVGLPVPERRPPARTIGRA